MQRILISAVLLFFAAGAFAQTPELTGRIWRITEDKMTGIGKHESLPEGTILEFREDGTWTSSAPIGGAATGTWLRSSGDQLRMTFGDDPKSRKVNLLVLTAGELRIRLNYLKGSYTYTWKVG